METSVALIVSKIEQLIVAVGGKVEAFYPIVKKQVIIEGWMALIGLCASLLLVIFNFGKCFAKGSWDEDGSPKDAVVMVSAALLIVGAASSIVFLIVNTQYVLAILNPDYYAVQRIVELGKGIVK
jgi:hypothetical protein